MLPRALRSDGKPSIHLRDWGGHGSPVLLLHGMAGNTYWWDKTAPGLLPNCRPVAMDLRGHGDSDAAESGVYDTEGFVCDIETARKTLGWERFTLLAHSLGARIGLEYARLHRERLVGMVVVDFLGEFLTGSSRRFERGLARRQPVYCDREIMVSRFHLEPPGTLLGPADLQALARHCIRSVPQGYSWKFDWKALQYRYEPIWPVLPMVKVPAFVVRGGQSAVMSHSDYERVLREIPGAQGLEIAHAHHHLPLETPEELSSAVNRFVAEILKREELLQG